MDDLQRQPKDDDRERLTARISQAHAEGRIGLADRDIRLGNVRHAQSMAELDLISRELDQLDAALPPGSNIAPATPEDRPWSTFEPGQGADHNVDEATGTMASAGGGVPSTARPARVAVLLALVVLAAAVAVYVGFRASDDPGQGPAANPAANPSGQPEPASEVPATPEVTKPAGDPPAPGSSYSLTGPGVRGFLQTYEKRFGTSRVVDLVLYGDYAIVNVPVPGKARQEGWLYRNGSWTGFGGVRAVFPGSQVIDTRQLAIPALVRNINRARATLNVEKPQTYVVMRFIRTAEPVPSVDIHVSNEFRESGYLATTLAGKVERAFPYSP